MTMTINYDDDDDDDLSYVVYLFSQYLIDLLWFQ